MGPSEAEAAAKRKQAQVPPQVTAQKEEEPATVPTSSSPDAMEPMKTKETETASKSEVAKEFEKDKEQKGKSKDEGKGKDKGKDKAKDKGEDTGKDKAMEPMKTKKK